MNKLIAMKNTFLFLLAIITLYSCTSKTSQKEEKIELPADINLVDTVLKAKNSFVQTDIISVESPNMTQTEAYDLQYEILDKYLAKGYKVEGYKMGGAVAKDAEGFKPIHAYMLDANHIAIDSVIDVKNFPGGQTMVEGEIGFIMGADLPNGAKTKEEALAAVESVIGAVEFAQPLTVAPKNDPEGMSTSHLIAGGVGHAGFIVGEVFADPKSFDFENETVKCFVNNELVTTGSSSAIFGTPVNALYHLANLLLERGTYLKKGQVIITGSTFQNPTLDGPASVRLEFSTLGNITFSSK